MAATVKDVAKAAQVSVGTVSRVLSGEPNVTEETAQRVLKAVEDLNYSRLRRRKQDASGQTLQNRKIALLLLGMDRSLASLPSVASSIHAAESALSAAGAQVLLADLPHVDRLPPAMHRRQVHGVIAKAALQGQLVANATDELTETLRNLPTVWFLGRPQNADWGDAVESNDSEIGRLAAEYLIRRGHRRLALIDPKPDHVTLGKRCASFAWHAAQADAAIDQIFGRDAIWSLPLKAVEDVEVVDKLVDRLLKLKRRPTAIFVPADSIAALVCRACAARGIRIGHDLSLISCNNERPLLSGLYPEITTIDIGAEQIGRLAVDQLIWRFGHRDAANVTVSVEPRLIEGMSVTNPGKS